MSSTGMDPTLTYDPKSRHILAVRDPAGSPFWWPRIEGVRAPPHVHSSTEPSTVLIITDAKGVRAILRYIIGQLPWLPINLLMGSIPSHIVTAAKFVVYVVQHRNRLSSPLLLRAIKMDREIYTEDERWQSPVSDAYLDLWEKNKEKSDTYLHLSGESIAPPYAIRENLILLAVGRDRWQVFDLSSGPRSRLGRTFKVRADPGNVVLGLKQAFFYERASRKCYLLTLGKADLELLPVTRLVDRRDRDGFVLAEGNEEHIVYDLDTGNRFTARWNKPWAVEQLGLEAGYLQEFYGALSSIFPIDRREGRSGPDNNERIMSLIDMLLHNDLRKEAAFIAEELGPLDKAATLWSAAGASDGEKYHAAQILARLGMEYQAARTVRKAKGFFQKASQLFYAVGEMELADFFTRQAQG